MGNGDEVDIFYLDFTKTFDMFDHKMIYAKFGYLFK